MGDGYAWDRGHPGRPGWDPEETTSDRMHRIAWDDLAIQTILFILSTR
jgi:hypothetical protein